MSKQSSPLQALTFVAAGAIAAYRGVGFGGAQASIAGQKIMGVSQRAAVTGEASDVVTSGTTIVESGDAIAVGDSLIMDANGRAIPVTGPLAVDAGATAMTSSAANGEVLIGADLPEFVFADALEAASAAGEFIEVKMR